MSTIVEVSVAAQADDCIVFNTGAGWAYSHTNANQFAGYFSATQLKNGGGMRFLNVNIPIGATIDTAYLVLVCRNSRNATTVNTVVIGEKSATPATFSTIADYQARRGTVVGGADDTQITDASVDWLNIPAWTAGTTYNSPEIKPIIQEIVDLGTWVGDGTDDIVLFWDDHAGNSSAVAAAIREGASLDDVTYDPPLLHVEYSAGVTHYGAATLSGIGTLAGIGRGIFTGVATLAGAGTLASIGQLIAVGKATLSGVGSLSAQGVMIVIGQAIMSGAGALVAIGKTLSVKKEATWRDIRGDTLMKLTSPKKTWPFKGGF